MSCVYLDNNVVSAMSRRDAPNQNELCALDRLLRLQNTGTIVLCTSRQSPREMERAPLKYQEELKDTIRGLEMTPDDHRVLGSFNVGDPYGGCICNPLVSDVVDESLYANLQKLGLKDDDAKHLMYAVQNGCERFLTWDQDFLSWRSDLARLCPSIKIEKPSEFVADVG